MLATLDAPARPPVVGRQRVFARVPDPAWVRELATIAPRSEVHTWLHLAWEPGDAWEPVERWVIWQMRPVPLIAHDAMGSAILAELRGPSPRSTGHYCGPRSACPCKPHERPDCWKGGAATLVTQRQWDLFRATGCYGTPWWLVQGTGGGHLRRFDRIQTLLSQVAGGPTDPPLPGELAYATPDARTWRAIRAYDAMQADGRLLERSAEAMNAAEQTAMEAARVRLLDWMGTQMRDALDEGGSAFRRALADQRPAAWQRTPDPDYEALEQDFVSDL